MNNKFPPRLFGAKGDVLPMEADYISVEEHEAICGEIEEQVNDIEYQRDVYKKAAEEWMNDYQKIKDKYEPMILVTSGKTVCIHGNPTENPCAACWVGEEIK